MLGLRVEQRHAEHQRRDDGGIRIGAEHACVARIAHMRDDVVEEPRQHREHRSRFGEIGIARDFAEKEPSGRRMRAQIVAIPDEKMRHRQCRVGLAREPALDLLAELLARAHQHGLVERLLRREVMKHVRFADTGLARDVADRNAVEPALGKEALGRAEDAVEGGDAGWRWRVIGHGRFGID